MLTKSSPKKANIWIRIFLTLNTTLLILVLMGFKNSYTETNRSMATSNVEVMGQISNTLEGFVVNKYGKYIDGLKIIVSGKNSGITTDKMGHFEISNIPQDASLTFSYQGYITQTIEPNGAPEMVVKLIIENESTLPKEKIIEAFLPKPGTNPLLVIDEEVMSERLSMADIDPNNGVSSIIILKGKDAIDKYGDKGKNGIIEILTIGKTTGSAEKKTTEAKKVEPLLVLDGVVSTKRPGDIPIQDIQTMTVLKDKNAIDKYGEKGTNGVIEITTKIK